MAESFKYTGNKGNDIALLGPLQKKNTMPFIQKLRRVNISDKNFTNHCYHFYNDTTFFKQQLCC